MIRCKIDIMKELKKKGYSSYAIVNDHIFGNAVIQKMRHGEVVSWSAVEKLCRMLGCQPGDIYEYVPDGTEQEPKPVLDPKVKSAGAEKIWQIITERNTTLKATAQKVGISANRLGLKITNDNMTRVDAQKIADALGCKIVVTFVDKETGQIM